jgi:hypothetical protein
MHPTISRYIQHYGASLTVHPDATSVKFIAVLRTRQCGVISKSGTTVAEALDRLALAIAEKEAA